MADATKLTELEGVVAETIERVAKRDEQIRRDCFNLRNSLIRFLTAHSDAVQFTADSKAIDWTTGKPGDPEADHLVKDELGAFTTNLVVSISQMRFMIPLALTFDTSAQMWLVSAGTKAKQFRFQDTKRICEWVHQAIKARAQGAAVVTLPMVI